MSGFDYLRSRGTASRLVEKFGQTATLIRPGAATGPDYDPTPGTPTSYPVTVVVSEFANRDIDGARIKATDKKVLMAVGAQGIEPATSDRLLIGGTEHAIIRVAPTAPGGTVVMFELQARR